MTEENHRSLREAVRDAISNAELPAQQSHDDKGTAFTVFDYLGLALILEPPAIVIGAVMTGQRLVWTNAVWGIPFLIIGGISIGIGRNLVKIRKWLGISFAANSYLSWIVAVSVLSYGGAALFGLGLFTAPPTLPPDVMRWSSNDNFYEFRPLGFWWSGSNLEMQASGPPNTEMQILGLSVLGKNFGPDEVAIKDAFLVSGITGTKIHAKIEADPGGMTDLKNIEAVPVGAQFRLHFQFGNSEAAFGSDKVSESDFLSKWGTFAFVIQYDDKTIRHEFSNGDVISRIASGDSRRQPHVTKRRP